jgi:ATP-binding cassette, subfamily B, bacterial PglK
VLDTFRKTFFLVGREKPARWVALILGAIVTSAFEMAGALLVFALLALIADPHGQVALPLIGDIRGWFPGVEEQQFLLGAAVVLGVFFLVRVVVTVAYTYLKHRMANNAGARLSSRLAEGYLRLPYTFHLRRSTAELVRNAHQTVEQLAQQCFLSVIYVIAEGMLILGLLAVLLYIEPIGTALAIVIVGGAALLLLRLVQPELKRQGSIAQETRSRSLATLQQALHGIRDIKVFGSESHFGRAYHQDRRDLSRALYLRGTAIELPRHVIETALIGFILVLFAFSVTTGVATQALLSTLGLFAYAGLRMLPSLQKVVSALNYLRFSGPAIDQTYADLELVTQVTEAPDETTISFDDSLRLEEVSFAYEQTEHPALAEVNLTITPGEVIGICGPTGGGKTTLADLVTGILSPTTGSITVDGVDIRDHLPAWFRKLGVVPQMVFLVDDTLRRNIAFGVADDEIDDVALEEAVHLAQLQEVVASLPDGLETEVGERGVRLSGGQRQRVAIARALYRRPEVLIFDEGTSALDNTTESVLIASLERLRGAHTILLIAHRLSTVRNADRIVYLENGRIAGLGTFEELRAQSEGFRSLAQHG